MSHRGTTAGLSDPGVAARRRAESVLSLSVARAERGRVGVCQPGALLAVTTRPAIRLRIEAVATSLGLPRPAFAADPAEVLESGADCSVLLLDLGSCCADASLGAVVSTWAAYRPGSEVILFTPLLDRERELKVAVSILTTTCSAEVRVMTASDFYRDEVWRTLAALRERAALEAELRGEFLTAVAETGRPLRAEPVVLELLHQAPKHPDIEAAPETALARVRLASEKSGSERTMLWKLLRRSGQMPASWLLLVFRVLWYVKLRERGWSAGRIARFLGFASPRHFRKTVRRRFGVGITQLAAVRYADALRWAAALVTSDHSRLGHLPVRALVTPLLNPARPHAVALAATGRHARRQPLG